MTHYAVSTDDDAIAIVARAYGAYVIKRPAELAQDDTPTLPALQHAVDEAERLWGKFDYVVDLRCTNPMKTADDISNAVDKLIATGAESVIGVSPSQPIERIKQVVDGKIVDVIHEPQDGQRQALPQSYIRNGSIYALRRDAMHKLFGHENSLAYIMPKERGVNIDAPLDWMLAERLLDDLGS